MKRFLSVLISLSVMAAMLAAPMSTTAASTGTTGFQNTISAGSFHSLAVGADGTLWTWGYSGYGELGNGKHAGKIAQTYELPKEFDGSAYLALFEKHGAIQASPGKVASDVVSVYGSEDQSYFIKKDGSLWAMGNNDELTVSDRWWHALGNGAKRIDHAKPVKIAENVVSVSSTDTTSVLVKKDGTLWHWVAGSNAGPFYPNDDDYDATLSWEQRRTPNKIMNNVVHAEVAYNAIFAIKKDGSLWAWGAEAGLPMGNGKENGFTWDQIKIMDNVATISLGYTHAFAVKKDGSLWAWGSNMRGQIGDGTTKDRLKPVKVMDNVVSASAGGNMSYAVKKDGSLWAWGANNESGNIGGLYQYTTLGAGRTDHYITKPVKILDNVAAVSSSSSGTHTMAVMKDGTLWTWGSNAYGQLGIGKRTNVNGPISENRKPTKIMKDIKLPVKK